MDPKHINFRSEIPALLNLSSLVYLQNLSKSQFGEVWKVRFGEDSSPYMLKKLSKCKIRRVESQFMRELSRWFKIRHKNLQQLSSFSEDDEFFYLLMEPLEGPSLLKRLQQGFKPDKSFSRQVLTQVLDALEHLHSLHPPVIYKHVHPDSIFIDSAGLLKLADSSWPGGSLDEEAGLGSSTLDYLAPEMFGKAEFGVSIDVWAVGVLAFELLAGRSPFRKAGNTGVLADIQKAKVSYPNDFDVLMKNLLGRVLVADPAKRVTIAEIKAHKWFLTRKVEIKDLISVSQSYFQAKITQQKLENEKIAKQVQNVQENIEVLNENYEKLAEKIRNCQQVSEILNNENEKSEKSLKDLLGQELAESDEVECLNYSGQIQKLNEKILALDSLKATLLETRVSRSACLEIIDSNHQLLETRLFFLNEFHKSMLSPSLMMAKALVFSVPPAEVEVFNQLCNSVNVQFSQCCESLLTKIQDLDNLIFLKERYLCELSVLYQEKQKQLLSSYQAKKNELEAKSKKNKEENLKGLKRFAEELMNRQGKIEVVDLQEVQDKRMRFQSVLSKMDITQKNVRLAKRDLLKIRVRIFYSQQELGGKVEVLTNLTDALMQAKAGMKIFKARKLC